MDATRTVEIESADDVALADKMNHGRKQIIAELQKRIVGQADVITFRGGCRVAREQIQRDGRAGQRLQGQGRDEPGGRIRHHDAAVPHACVA